MEKRELHPFDQPDERTPNHFKLILARKLQTIWADVLQEPIPPDLQALLDRLEHGRHAIRADVSGSHNQMDPE